MRQVFRGDAEIDEDAVGGPGGACQCFRSRGRDEDGAAVRDPGQMRALSSRQVAGSPASSLRMKVVPAASSPIRERPSPILRVPLCPVPRPRIARPGASRSSEAIAAADAAGCRDSRLLTQSATRARPVSCAIIVAATHGSIALPGVSAMPTMSKP